MKLIEKFFSTKKNNSKKACLMHLKTLNDFSNIFTTNFDFFLLFNLPIWCVCAFYLMHNKIVPKKKVFFFKIEKKQQQIKWFAVFSSRSPIKMFVQIFLTALKLSTSSFEHVQRSSH